MQAMMTIDDELYRQLEEIARRDQRSVRDVIEEMLRSRLREAAAQRYEPLVHHSALAPGVDPNRLGALADELAQEDAIGRLIR
jgi:hypothetical protein